MPLSMPSLGVRSPWPLVRGEGTEDVAHAAARHNLNRAPAHPDLAMRDIYLVQCLIEF